MKYLLPFLLLATSFAAGQTDYERGKNLYFEKGCNGCHGIKAEGMAAYPMLANRAKGFLTYKLKRFRNEISDNQQQEMMIPFAKELNDKQIELLSTFLNLFHDEQNEHYDIDFEQEGDGGS